MAFIDALRALNVLKRHQVVRDYVIIGAVAATAYMEPMSTADLDVIALVDTDEEYVHTLGLVAEHAEAQDGLHYVLGGVPVQVFPSTVMPLYRDTLQQARKTRIGNLRVKVATPEHLILLGLLANREQDRFRVRHLLREADPEQLGGLLKRFDDAENVLAARLENLRGTSIPREGEVASPPGADEL